MFEKGKVIVRDVLFVSKITQVNNKKRTIFGAVLLSSAICLDRYSNNYLF